MRFGCSDSSAAAARSGWLLRSQPHAGSPVAAAAAAFKREQQPAKERRGERRGAGRRGGAGEVAARGCLPLSRVVRAFCSMTRRKTPAEANRKTLGWSSRRN